MADEPSAAPPAFRDPTRLTQCLKVLLWTGIVVGAIAIGSGLLELKLLYAIDAGETLPPGTSESSDLRQQVIGILRFIIIVATIVVFGMWIYRANCNARALGAAGMQFRPGWSVGWYFIPIANLWKPYQAMREIWKASAAPTNWHQQPRGAILPWWWFFFLVSNVFNQASFRLTMAAKTLSEIIAASSLSAVSDTVDVVSWAIALVLVGQIFRMQMAHADSAAAPGYPTAPPSAFEDNSRKA